MHVDCRGSSLPGCLKHEYLAQVKLDKWIACVCSAAEQKPAGGSPETNTAGITALGGIQRDDTAALQGARAHVLSPVNHACISQASNPLPLSVFALRTEWTRPTSLTLCRSRATSASPTRLRGSTIAAAQHQPPRGAPAQVCGCLAASATAL